MPGDDLQILVRDILEGVNAMFEQQKHSTQETIETSERRTRVLIENQDKKLNAIAENLGTRLDRVENRLGDIESRLGNLETDMKVVKAVITTHSEEIYTLKRVK